MVHSTVAATVHRAGSLTDADKPWLRRRMTIDRAAVLDSIRDNLGNGASSRKSPMHAPVVGTADGDLRVMVLRGYDPDCHTLRFHTDARSPKVAAVQADPAIGILAYDAQAKVQIRIRGTGRVERDTPAVDAIWAESSTFARRCYLAGEGPSSHVPAPTSGLPGWAEGIQPTEDQVAPARANFAVFWVTVERYDWLYLSNEGHRRARVTLGAEGETLLEWLVP